MIRVEDPFADFANGACAFNLAPGRENETKKKSLHLRLQTCVFSFGAHPQSKTESVLLSFATFWVCVIHIF